eukprot:gene4815-biopygen171
MRPSPNRGVRPVRPLGAELLLHRLLVRERRALADGRISPRRACLPGRERREWRQGQERRRRLVWRAEGVEGAGPEEEGQIRGGGRRLGARPGRVRRERRLTCAATEADPHDAPRAVAHVQRRQLAQVLARCAALVHDGAPVCDAQQRREHREQWRQRLGAAREDHVNTGGASRHPAPERRFRRLQDGAQRKWNARVLVQRHAQRAPHRAVG